MAFHIPEKGNAAPGDCGRGAPEPVQAGRLDSNPEDKATGNFVQVGAAAKPVIDNAIKKALERERIRAEYRLARLDIIIEAMRQGIFTDDLAAEIAGVTIWPAEFGEAAREWRAQRYGRAAA